MKVTIGYVRFNEYNVSLSTTKATLNQSGENKQPLVLVSDRAYLNKHFTNLVFLLLIVTTLKDRYFSKYGNSKVTIGYVRFNGYNGSLSATKATLNQSGESKQSLVLVSDRTNLNKHFTNLVILLLVINTLKDGYFSKFISYVKFNGYNVSSLHQSQPSISQVKTNSLWY